jgi:hypothetical protein
MERFFENIGKIFDQVRQTPAESRCYKQRKPYDGDQSERIQQNT